MSLPRDEGRKALAVPVVAAAVLAAGVILGGCSDTSRMSLEMTSIVGVDLPNANRHYLECDLIGNNLSACQAIQDQVTVTVTLKYPSSSGIGPRLDGYITGFTIEYFYYDPADGALKGPISYLTTRASNLRHSVSANSTATFKMPLMTYQVKAWSVGNTCNGIPGFTGGTVQRFTVRVTVTGEDGTGKKLSCAGSILAYLYDYPPLVVATDTCASYASPVQSYWQVVCPP